MTMFSKMVLSSSLIENLKGSEKSVLFTTLFFRVEELEKHSFVFSVVANADLGFFFFGVLFIIFFKLMNELDAPQWNLQA